MCCVCPCPSTYPPTHPTNQQTNRPDKDGDKKDGDGASAASGGSGSGGGGYSTLYEVSVLRSPAVVHLYRVIEYGRRFYRHLIFSSDAGLSLHSFDRKELATLNDRTRFVGGTTNETSPPGFSMVITRNLYSSVGLQAFIPHRLLTGLLPSAILDAYDFWQNEDDSLIGYPRREEGGAGASASVGREHGQTVVKVDLVKDNSQDTTGFGNSRALGMVRRIAVESETDFADLKWEARADNTLTLLNVLYSPQGPLRQLVAVISRLEDVSHVLVWTKTPLKAPNEPCAIHVVELPRLGLTFRAKEVVPGDPATRLYCDDYDGYFISNVRSPALERLAEGLPHSIILENADHDLFLLVAAAKPGESAGWWCVGGFGWFVCMTDGRTD